MFPFDKSLNTWDGKEVTVYLTNYEGETIEYYGLFNFHDIFVTLTNDSRKHKSGNGIADFKIQFVKPTPFLTLCNWTKFRDDDFDGEVIQDSQFQTRDIHIEESKTDELDGSIITELSKSNGKRIVIMLEMFDNMNFPPGTFKSKEMREMRNGSIVNYKTFFGDLDLKPYQIKITNNSSKYPPVEDSESDFELVVLREGGVLVAKYYSFRTKQGFQFQIPGFKFFGNET